MAILKDDPRLPPLDDGWQFVERERTVEDPRIFRVFRNNNTGEEQKEDPRMSADNLRKMGVKLCDFSLI